MDALIVTDNSAVSFDNEHLVKTQIWRATLLTHVLPTIGFITGIAGIFIWGIGWLEIISLVTMYFFTVAGVEIGFHRLFTHKAFKTNKAITAILAILGSMSAQGPVIFWVATHRRHHVYSDKENDPHSPNLESGKGLGALIKGLWHAHVRWQFVNDLPNTAKLARDLLKDDNIRWVNKNYLKWVYLGLIIPAVAAGLITLSLKGAALGFLWGGLIRVFLVNHATYSLNSFCHVFGGQLFKTDEQSRNNILFVIPTLGQGWHNNHHAFPNAADLSFKWWQFDPSAILIQGLRITGLAWDVKKPNKNQIDNKLKRN
ncbi:acyl-CoA desaturase [Chitinophaga nivalis]|uniref:Fatty acid desaturase n=1 Tax=Chitinophaga nivalis TaxID=2991709 RepID=A0ABT3IMS6_9BACT|nr:fatty acid desaturase [Chitinophaga nivalis]MCW3465038.1 fatty acid desaturase [Chitinophaga nivalis]MCW3485270.1 fatty acid desaturase [Chitinophaga nivalis]